MHGKRVGVLMGGLSSERDLSLLSGEAVFEALRARRPRRGAHLRGQRSRSSSLRSERIEVAFLALHGRYGEDGCVQGMLELMGIPYTGPSLLGAALATDKVKTKELLRLHNLPTPSAYVHRLGEGTVVGAARQLRVSRRREAPRRGQLARRAARVRPRGALARHRGRGQLRPAHPRRALREWLRGARGGARGPRARPRGDRARGPHLRLRGASRSRRRHRILAAAPHGVSPSARRRSARRAGRPRARVRWPRRGRRASSPTRATSRSSSSTPCPRFSPDSMVGRIARSNGLGFAELCQLLLSHAQLHTPDRRRGALCDRRRPLSFSTPSHGIERREDAGPH